MPDHNLFLAPFDLTEDELILSRAPNGGYVIQRAGRAHCIMPTVIGAFSSAADMMAALSAALLPAAGAANG